MKKYSKIIESKEKLRKKLLDRKWEMNMFSHWLDFPDFYKSEINSHIKKIKKLGKL